MTTIDGHPDCDTPLHRRRSGTLGKAFCSPRKAGAWLSGVALLLTNETRSSRSQLLRRPRGIDWVSSG